MPLSTPITTEPSLTVLMETSDWIIIAKPPGILVHSHPRFPTEKTIIERLSEQLEQPVWTVHRLDRQASGCLIYAKNRDAVQPLSESLANGQKTYLALVRGFFRHEGKVVVENPMKVRGKMRDAKSVVWKIGATHEPRSSLLMVQPQTGRFHQVRRHVRDLHHPILHDGDHGDSKVNRWWRENRGLKRLGLHALSIEIEYNGQRIQCDCPLFSDHIDVLKCLPFWGAALIEEPRLGLTALTWSES